MKLDRDNQQARRSLVRKGISTTLLQTCPSIDSAVFYFVWKEQVSFRTMTVTKNFLTLAILFCQIPRLTGQDPDMDTSWTAFATGRSGSPSLQRKASIRALVCCVVGVSKGIYLESKMHKTLFTLRSSVWEGTKAPPDPASEGTFTCEKVLLSVSKGTLAPFHTDKCRSKSALYSFEVDTF